MSAFPPPPLPANATDPTKFFGIELGAQVQMDDQLGRYIVNGAHNAEDLSKLLDRFIKKFVLCQKCGNPETDMAIDKSKQITLKCKACGHLSKADNAHKLITFILNHPPNGGAPEGKAGKRTKEERRREKAERAHSSGKSSTKNSDDDEPERADGGGDDSGLQFTPALTVAAGQPTVVSDAPARTATPEAAAKSPAGGDDEAFTVDEETLRRARENELNSLNENVRRALSIDDAAKAAEKKEADMYDEFAAYLTNNKPTVDGVKQQIRFLDDEKAMAVLAQVLFNESVLEQLKQHKDLLTKVVANEKAQKGLLGGLERLVGLTHPNLMNKMPHILKVRARSAQAGRAGCVQKPDGAGCLANVCPSPFQWCYDNDVLEEEVILAWGKKPSKKYLDKETAAAVRKHAQPILDWLETAEEESSSDDE